VDGGAVLLVVEDEDVSRANKLPEFLFVVGAVEPEEGGVLAPPPPPPPLLLSSSSSLSSLDSAFASGFSFSLRSRSF
jgi:hypothetical protein